MYFITTKRMLELCFSAHPNIQYRTSFLFSFQGEVAWDIAQRTGTSGSECADLKHAGQICALAVMTSRTVKMVRMRSSPHR